MQFGSTEQASSRTHIYAILVILIATTLPYLNSFQGVFDFDDVHTITENSYIRIQDFSWSSLSPIFTIGPTSQRWLPMLSLAVNYYIGGYEPFGYHLVNLAIHLITAILLYYFCSLVLAREDKNLNNLRIVEVSFFAALLWSLHPAQTNAVTYVVQRMASMAAMFSLATCICYMKGRISTIRIQKWLWWTGAVFLWVLALGSKENSAIIPLVILGLDFYFFRQSGESRRPYLIISTVAGVAGILLVFYSLGSNPLITLRKMYSTYNFNIVERLMTESTVIFYYIGILLLPFPSRLNLCYDYPVSRSLLNPPWTLPAVTGVILLVLSIFLLFRKHRLLSFALFWFLVNLIIESSVFPIELIYEHRLYLPSMMLFLAVSTYLYRHFDKGNGVQSVRVGMVIICLLLAVGTWQRNKVWLSQESLWTDVLEKSPNITRAYTNLGRVYNTQQKYEKSMEILRKGLEIDPRNGLIWLNIGYIYMMNNQYDKAVSAYITSLSDDRIGNNEFKVRTALAFAYIRKNQPAQALVQADQSLRLNSTFPNSWVAKGMSHGLLGKHDEAFESGRKAVFYDSQFLEGYLLMARALDHMGRSGNAMAVLNQAQAARNGDPTGISPFRDYLSRKMAESGR